MHDSQHIHGHFNIHIHGGFFHMSQVTGSFSVNVKSGGGTNPNPLTLTPTSGSLPQETEGVAIAGDLVAKVSGGVPPYTYDFSASPLPAGVTPTEVDNGDGTFSIELTGTPAVGDSTGGDGAGNYTVAVTVTDSAGTTGSATASARRPLNVARR